VLKSGKLIENFKNIEYLKSGNERQKLAYAELNKIDILEILKKYHPILVGTIPITIDVPGSDLDIICTCENHLEFSNFLTEKFSDKKEFKIYTCMQRGRQSTIAQFRTDHFLIEIFGQNIPTEKQNAYRHMVIERRILEEKGLKFKEQIIKLKSSGMKTEPAFAKLLGLDGDPYDELLKLE